MKITRSLRISSYDHNFSIIYGFLEELFSQFHRFGLITAMTTRSTVKYVIILKLLLKEIKVVQEHEKYYVYEIV